MNVPEEFINGQQLNLCFLIASQVWHFIAQLCNWHKRFMQKAIRSMGINGLKQGDGHLSRHCLKPTKSMGWCSDHSCLQSKCH